MRVISAGKGLVQMLRNNHDISCNGIGQIRLAMYPPDCFYRRLVVPFSNQRKENLVSPLFWLFVCRAQVED